MAKKILSFFYTDLHWKLISLGLAFVIWFVAMNWHDPQENTSFPRDLQILNTEILRHDNVVLLNTEALRATSINLGIRGYRSALGAVDVAELFVYVDMRAVNSAYVLASDGPITLELPVNANLLSGYELQYVRPARVMVELDRLERASFPLEVYSIGQVRDGYELRSITAANLSVLVTAARSIIETIDYVKVEVDLTDVYESGTVDSPIIVIDRDGYDITDQVILLSVNATTVRLQVLPVRTVELRVETVGEMAAGFIEAEIRPSILVADIVGEAEILDEVEYILLNVDLHGLSGSIERPVDIASHLPEGIELSKNVPEDITVTITVEPIQVRPFFVPRRDVSFREYGALYQTLNDPATFRVVVSGPQSIVSAMTTADLNVHFDLRNLPVGIHHVPLTVPILPPGVSLAEQPQTLEVQIFAPGYEDPDPPDEPEPTPTAEPEPTPEPEPSPTPEPSPLPSPTPTTTPSADDTENGNGDDDPYDSYAPYDENDPPSGSGNEDNDSE